MAKYEDIHRSDILRRELEMQLNFITLLLTLLPHLRKLDTARVIRNQMMEWIRTASPYDILENAASAYDANASLIELYLPDVGPRKPWELIADEFASGVRKGNISWSHGVEWHWLCERFDKKRLVSQVGIPEDFPLHGTIGLASHVGRFAVQDALILWDAFYLLEKCNSQFERLKTCMNPPESASKDAIIQIAKTANATTCGLARICSSTGFSFFECFVNSVGESASRETKYTPEEVEILTGRRGKSYVRLEVRIERIPMILTGSTSPRIKTIDPAQRIEPFKSLLSDVRDLRDSSAHYAPSKRQIWLRPQEWHHACNANLKTCVDAASAFWRACFPLSRGPQYLELLDWEYWSMQGKKLVISESMSFDAITTE